MTGILLLGMMELPELWGWVETLMVRLGLWSMLTTILSIVVAVTVGLFALRVLRR